MLNWISVCVTWFLLFGVCAFFFSYTQRRRRQNVILMLKMRMHFCLYNNSNQAFVIESVRCWVEKRDFFRLNLIFFDCFINLKNVCKSEQDKNLMQTFDSLQFVYLITNKAHTNVRSESTWYRLVSVSLRDAFSQCNTRQLQPRCAIDVCVIILKITLITELTTQYQRWFVYDYR